MHRKSLIRLLPFLVLLVVSPVLAQYPREKAALQKIDEAINQHYLATEFDKAEAVLTGTIIACDDKCSPATIAKAWMYVGLVRGSGKQDTQGATEAFTKALAIDGNVALDETLATPEVKATFLAAGGAAAPAATTPAPAATDAAKPPPAAKDEGEGSMVCSPDVREVQTRRAIPMSCSTDESAARMEIRYKEYGGKWKTATMQKVGDEFRGLVPCGATKVVGTLNVYVRALDSGDDLVDSLGSKSKPLVFQVAQEVQAEPPSYPGEKPPARCAEEVECPPDFPGCGSASKASSSGGMCGDKDWGASCAGSGECKCGLLCIDGGCETAPSCTTDSDCPTNVCDAGKCAAALDEGDEKPYNKNLFGLHIAQDFSSIGGNDVCVADYQAAGGTAEGFSCFQSGSDTPYVGEPFPGDSNAPSGVVLATTRLLISYDRAFMDHLTLGVRAGYAIGGGPPAGKKDENALAGEGAKLGNPFLPYHAEGRGVFWIRSLSATGLLPYIHLGGGLAQVDAKLQIKGVRDCNQLKDPVNDPINKGKNIATPFQKCVNGAVEANQTAFLQSAGDDVDAYRKMGQGFVTLGGGAMYKLGPRFGLQLNINAMIMLPTSGLVIEPSLGAVYGL
ncbi:MAG: hypothetical protein SFV15_03355 [Polyangiaceae bacterium]|nr:hypothetical protein [Polyangiaceae bacterium]